MLYKFVSYESNLKSLTNIIFSELSKWNHTCNWFIVFSKYHNLPHNLHWHHKGKGNIENSQNLLKLTKNKFHLVATSSLCLRPNFYTVYNSLGSPLNIPERPLEIYPPSVRCLPTYLHKEVLTRRFSPTSKKTWNLKSCGIKLILIARFFPSNLQWFTIFKILSWSKRQNC